MRTIAVVFFGVLASALAGCGGASGTDTSTAGDNALTDTGGGAVPAFTAADGAAVPAYSGRVRLSVNGAPFVQSDVTGSRGVCATDPTPYGTLVGSPQGQFEINFGKPGAFPPALGVYSCADGDVAIAKVAWNKDGTSSEDDAATTCSLVIDSITPNPNAGALEYQLVFGHFDAAAAATKGLPVGLSGTFAIYLPADNPGTQNCKP